jgi:hypothetical protein
VTPTAAKWEMPARRNEAGAIRIAGADVWMKMWTVAGRFQAYPPNFSARQRRFLSDDGTHCYCRRMGQYEYEMVRKIQRELRQKERRKRPLYDLLALSQNNDPYNAGSPNDWEVARWFEDVWRRFDYGAGTHLRRIHYRLVVAGDFKKHDGSTYLNTVEAADFDDHRNPNPFLAEWCGGDTPEPMVIAPVEMPDVTLPEIDTNISALADFEVLPPIVTGYDPDDHLDRDYVLEIWIEKSTMNDILLPICRELKVNFVPAVGIQSISNSVKLLQRCVRLKKPGRVFYISDFDPAGDIMPVGVARQLEFYRGRYAPDIEIKLTPLALTAAQAVGLPRVPIKTISVARALRRYMARAVWSWTRWRRCGPATWNGWFATPSNRT